MVFGCVSISFLLPGLGWHCPLAHPSAVQPITPPARADNPPPLFLATGRTKQAKVDDCSGNLLVAAEFWPEICARVGSGGEHFGFQGQTHFGTSTIPRGVEDFDLKPGRGGGRCHASDRPRPWAGTNDRLTSKHVMSPFFSFSRGRRKAAPRVPGLPGRKGPQSNSAPRPIGGSTEHPSYGSAAHHAGLPGIRNDGRGR
eukprot:scaffold8520_cov248-Pinguiococcus_pyrenoidosus.AAC.7